VSGQTGQHHLLPHERWWANFVQVRQQTRSTPAVAKLQGNFGPEGMRLLCASQLDLLLAVCVGLGTFLLYPLWNAVGVLDAALLFGSVVAWVASILAAVRIVQCVKQGREWRGGRPYQR
jgi:hypothetical protein